MTDIVVIVDLPIATAEQVDTTEVAMLLRAVTAANVKDFVDADDVEITPRQEMDYRYDQTGGPDVYTRG